MKKKNKPKKDAFDQFSIFWKVYLFLFALYYAAGLIALSGNINALSAVDLIVSLPSLVALYGLGFKKRFFAKFYWKLYFWFFVAWHFILNYWALSNSFFTAENLVPTLAILIVYIGLYIYAFRFLKR